MGRHLAPGRPACARDQQRQAPFRGREHPCKTSPGHTWPLTSTCANRHLATRKDAAVGTPVTIASAQLRGAGCSPPQASANPYCPFPRFTGWLEHAEAELQPWRRVVSRQSSTAPEVSGVWWISAPTLVSRHFSIACLQEYHIHDGCNTNLRWTEVDSHAQLNYSAGWTVHGAPVQDCRFTFGQLLQTLSRRAVRIHTHAGPS